MTTDYPHIPKPVDTITHISADMGGAYVPSLASHQHQDPAPHKNRVRIPRTPTPHRPRTPRPRSPPTPTPGPNLTHRYVRRARYVRVSSPRVRRNLCLVMRAIETDNVGVDCRAILAWPEKRRFPGGHDPATGGCRSTVIRSQPRSATSVPPIGVAMTPRNRSRYGRLLRWWRTSCWMSC